MSHVHVFLYVQHLLGIGHLKRSATLARALCAEGLQVTLASGGLPAPNLELGGARLVQLPATSAADLGFRALLDEAGRDVDDAWRARRRDALLAAWRSARPSVLVLELFPFGRRQMRFELLPLLEEAHAAAPKPAVLCSVRDILGGARSAERQEEAAALVERFFDRVLVHSDPAVVGFEHSFPLAGRIASRVEYTGYVVDPPALAGDAGKGEVVVSAGGGAVGLRLLEAAIRARPLTRLRDRAWRVLAGDNLPAADFAQLVGLVAGEGGIVVERARRDFATLLANCELSVSQAGYNTLLETVQAQARAVVVPFAQAQETEQMARARRFAARGLVEMLAEDDLSPERLAAAIDRAAGKPRPAAANLDLDGARRSARRIAQIASAGSS